MTPGAEQQSVVVPTNTQRLLSTPTLVPGVRQLIGYLPNFGIDGRFRVADVPAGQLSQVTYAFATISKAGLLALDAPDRDPANLDALRRLRDQHPGLRLAISAGGASHSKEFPSVARDPEARRRFADSAVALVRQFDLDGLDIDWEFPANAQERGSLTALLTELRGRLDAAAPAEKTRHYLTVAAPAGPDHYATFDLASIHPLVDWIGVMAYAFHGAWSPVTNFNAPLFASSGDPSPPKQREAYTADAAVRAYLAAGVPAPKLVLGVPFYGRGWSGAPPANHGLYQRAAGVPAGPREPGVFPYRDLKDHYLPTFERYWHDEAHVPWLYNAATGMMISYDDPQSLGAKAAYAVERGLGGVMAWELSSDDQDHSLVRALAEHVRA